MKPPRSLKISDDQVGSGRPVVPGDVAVCHYRCSRRKGDVVFASAPDDPFAIRVGARDCGVGIEYGLLGMRVGGIRTVDVPPNLTYVERQTFADLPENAMLIYRIELIDIPRKWDDDMEQRLADVAR